jgi:hypothetical protein
VPIKAVFPLAGVQEAHRTYARGSGVGSIVLDVSSHQLYTEQNLPLRRVPVHAHRIGISNAIEVDG